MKQKQKTDELEQNPSPFCNALGKRFPTQFTICCAKAFYGHVSTLSFKAEPLLLSYSLCIAHIRYIKYWSIRSVYILHPIRFPPKASSENTIQRLHDFSIKHSDLNSQNQT